MFKQFMICNNCKCADCLNNWFCPLLNEEESACMTCTEYPPYVKDEQPTWRKMNQYNCDEFYIMIEEVLKINQKSENKKTESKKLD